MFAEVLLKRLFLLFGASTFSSEVLTPRLPAGFFVGLRPWGGEDGAAAASEQEPCLCCAVAFDPQLLEVTPPAGFAVEMWCWIWLSGRLAISDIVADRPVPLDMPQDPELWSGCISGAWEEQDVLEAFGSLGFEHVHYADRQGQPWRVLEGIAFRSATLVAELPAGGWGSQPCC